MKRLAGWITGAIILFLIGSFVDPAVVQLREYYWSLKVVLFVASCLAPVLVFTLVTLIFILRGKDERSITRIVLLVLLFSLLARVAWVLTFDSYQVNDFGAYLGCASDVAVNGKPAASDFCRDGGFVYWRRAAFYTYPIVLLFGKSLSALKLVNVLYATLTGFFFFLAGKIIFGARVSAVGLLFFIWHPDLWYSMTLASHDVPGMFWLSIFFLLSALLRRRLMATRRRWGAIAGLSAATGLSVFFLAMVRSYQDGALLALFGCAAIHAWLILAAGRVGPNEVSDSVGDLGDSPFLRRARIAAVHAIFLLAVPFGVYSTAGRLFRNWHPTPVQADSSIVPCYLTSINVLGASRFDEISIWMDQCRTVPAAERTEFAVRKALHDMTHDPLMFLMHLVRKNRVLSRADDYLFWSAATEYESWDKTHDQVRRINSTRTPEQTIVVLFIHVGLILLVGWRLLLYPSVPFRLAETIPILFSAVYYGMFLFLLESQARYEIFLAFMFSWMAGQAALDIHARFAGIRRVPSRAPGLPGRCSILVGGAVCLLVIWFAYEGVAFAGADSWLTLRDQSGFSAVPAADAKWPDAEGLRIRPVFAVNDHKDLMVAYPTGALIQAGTVMAAQRKFTVNPNRQHHLRFFLSTDAVTYGPLATLKNWLDHPIEYLVTANGHIVAKGTLRDLHGNKYVSVYPRFPLGSEVTLQLLIRNDTLIDRVGPERSPVLALEYIDLQ